MITFTEYLKEAQTIQIEKGLTREEALKKATPKMICDHIGFSYNSKTSIATFI